VSYGNGGEYEESDSEFLRIKHPSNKKIFDIKGFAAFWIEIEE